MNLFEAFDKLKSLDEETFDVNKDGVEKLQEFQDDSTEDLIDIYDVDLDDDDDGCKCKTGDHKNDVVLDCSVCHSKVYKDKKDVKLDEEADLANVGDECPYCHSNDGYKVVGQIKECDIREDKDDICPECKKPLDKCVCKKVNEAVATRAPSIGKVLSKHAAEINQEYEPAKVKAKVKEILDNSEIAGTPAVETFKSRLDQMRTYTSLYNLIGTYLTGKSTTPKGLSKYNRYREKNESLKEDIEDNSAYSKLKQMCKECGYELVDAYWDGSGPYIDIRPVHRYAENIKVSSNRTGELDITAQTGAVGALSLLDYKDFLNQVTRTYRLLFYLDDFNFKGLEQLESTNESVSRIRKKNRKLREGTEDRKHWMDKFDAVYSNLWNHRDDYPGYWQMIERPIMQNMMNPDDSGDEGYFTGVSTDTIKKAYDLVDRFVKGEDISSEVGDVDETSIYNHIEDFKQLVNYSKNNNKVIKLSPAMIKGVPFDTQNLRDALEYGGASLILDGGTLYTAGFGDYKYLSGASVDADAAVLELKRLVNRYGLLSSTDNPPVPDITETPSLMEHRIKSYDKRKILRKISEALDEVEVKTGDTKLEVTSDKNGKVTVSAELQSDDYEDEVIEPVSPDTEMEIEGGLDEPADETEFDEESFDEVAEGYLRKVDESITSYKTRRVTLNKRGNKLVVEGVVRRGRNRNTTKFIFESKRPLKRGKAIMTGMNESFAKGANSPYRLFVKNSRGKIITEGLKYRHSCKSRIGKTYVAEGFVRGE